MQLTATQLVMMLATMALIIGAGILSARKIKSSEGFSLNGRSASAGMVAGAVTGSCIGGGATIGTAQLAFHTGLSAWWFTIGIGVGFVLMGLFFAAKFRETGRETISQILVSRYGRTCGPVCSVITSAGLFFAAAASVLPAIHMIAGIMNVSVWTSSAVLFLLVASYIGFGGMRGASVSGLLKSAILWLMLICVAVIAGTRLRAVPDIEAVIPDALDIFAAGWDRILENVISVSAGFVCAQAYAQAFFSARSAAAAKAGCFAAAAISLPVGLPCVMAAMYMRAAHPETAPIMALPEFAVTCMPGPLAGITLGALVVALVSSVAGLTLGISTLLTRDIWAKAFRLADGAAVLAANRLTVVAVALGLIVFSLLNLDSQVLMWNILALSLRAGIFIPLVLALYKSTLLPRRWAVPVMVAGAALPALSNPVLHLAVPPLFTGFAAALALLGLGAAVRTYRVRGLLYAEARGGSARRN